MRRHAAGRLALRPFETHRFRKLQKRLATGDLAIPQEASDAPTGATRSWRSEPSPLGRSTATT